MKMQPNVVNLSEVSLEAICSDIREWHVLARDGITKCRIGSHGTELIMLGRKLHSGTSKTKELVPVQPVFPLF